jgi:hypothetical protein
VIGFGNTNTSSIVSIPAIYYVLVEKFVLSNKALPIFFFDNRKDEYQIHVNLQSYSLVIDNAHYRGELYGTPRDSTGRTGGIYFIRQFLRVMNDGFAVMGSGIRMILRDDGRFQLEGAALGDVVTFSKKVYDLFPTLEAEYTDVYNAEYKIVIDSSNPPLPSVQESKAQYAWYGIKSILLISDDLPITKQGYITSDNSSQKLSILNEFPPYYGGSDSIDKTDWIFESTEYRPIDMNSQNGFNTFSFSIKLVSRYGELIEYRLAPGETASVTFRFAKKALFNNEYNLTRESDRIRQNPSYAYHKN